MRENKRFTRSGSMPALATIALLVAGCGGSGGGPAPIATPPPPGNVEALQQALGTLNVADYSVTIGDADGELLTVEFGAFRSDQSYFIASASKWLSAAVIMTLVEQGLMRTGDRPQDYLDWWTDDPDDPRSRVTLGQLLSFTAGFDIGSGDPSCVSEPLLTLDACARALYAGGLAYEPGTTFHYGPAHLQVAARMAEVAAGQSFSDLLQFEIAMPLGLFATRLERPSASNPRVAGGGDSSVRDYARFLQAIMRGEILSGVLADMRVDRTPEPVVIAERPRTIDLNGADWHYAYGHWRECYRPRWDASCDPVGIVSSPGGFGWYPWIDVGNGYYAVIGVQESEIDGASPPIAVVAFAERARPLILAALAELRAARP